MPDDVGGQVSSPLAGIVCHHKRRELATYVVNQSAAFCYGVDHQTASLLSDHESVCPVSSLVGVAVGKQNDVRPVAGRPEDAICQVRITARAGNRHDLHAVLAYTSDAK